MLGLELFSFDMRLLVIVSSAYFLGAFIMWLIMRTEVAKANSQANAYRSLLLIDRAIINLVEDVVKNHPKKPRRKKR